MPDDVTRREYIDGSSYPPALTGMRGGHAGSFDVGHAIRDGMRFDIEDLPVEETYRPGGGRRRHERARRGLVLSGAAGPARRS